MSVREAAQNTNLTRFGVNFLALPPPMKEPQMEESLEVIAGGTTGLIKRRVDSPFVEKAPYPNSRDARLSIRDLRREYAAYQRLPQHPRFLRLHSDSTSEKLVLPYLQHGCLHEFLRSPPVSLPQRLQFAADAAEGIDLLHGVGIVHGDINSWNFLIDDDFRLCIIDFSGSTIDGVPGSAFEGYRYCLPRPIDDPSTTRTDIFALGSLLYEIVTSEEPYEQCEDQEAVEYFEQRHFPATQDLPLARIILNCWQGAYDSAKAVFDDIREAVAQRGSI